MTDEEIAQEGERGLRLKNNPDWLWAKEKLEEFMKDYLSLASVPEYKTATSLLNEVSTRKKAAGVVRSWIEEVEGTGTQREINKVKPLIENELIARFGE